MADVQLNLIYNDNGAQNNVDKLVNVLRQIESRRYNINLSLPNMDRTNAQLHDMVDQLENIRKMSSGRPGEMFQGLSLSGLESAIQKAEASVNRYKQSIADFYGQLRNTKDAKEYDSILSQIENSNEGLINSTKQLASLRTIFDSLSETSGFKNLNQQIEDTIKNIENLQKYGTTNVTHDEAVGRRVSAMLGLSALPSSATTESPQSPRGKYARYLDYSGLSSHFAEEERRRMEEQKREQEKLLAEQKEKIEKTNAEIALGYHQTWRGIQQVVTGAINSLQSAYNAWKSTVEAPLNLTGVSSLVSMLESMEGSLLLNQISSNISTGFSQGVERYDILQSFPAVMEHIGYSADDASSAMDRLYQSVLGLPTSFGDIVQNTQFFTLVLDDLDKATDLAIAANNAFVASGASSQQISSGMRQLQYILEGTKLRSTQWYSLIRSMPLALREVGNALGYPDFNSFTADLMAGSIASEKLIDTLIDVGLNSEKLGGIIDVMKSRIQAALENVTNAGRRMGESITATLDSVLQREGGKGLTENIKGVSSVIDHITEVATNWIDKNGDKIQALVDKFFAIDWGSIVPSFLEGLVNIADKALDNIDKWIDDIGSILDTVKTTINSLDNAKWVKILSGTLSTLPAVAQFFAGYSNIRLGSALISSGVASGGSLSSAFAKLSSGPAVSLLSHIPHMSILLGSILAVVKTIAWDKSQKEENEKFVAEQETKNEVDRLVVQYENAVRSGNYGVANAAADNVYAYTGQSLVLPYVYSKEDAASALSAVYDYRRPGKIEQALIARAEDDILRAELESIGSSIPTELYEVWDKIWEGYQKRLDEVTRRADRISEKLKELREDADKWIDTTVADMANIYGGKGGKGGKFLSEHVKEAFGGLYRNTTNDYIMTQEEAGAAMSSINDKIMEAIKNMPESERKKAYEAWADYLESFDFTNDESLKQLETLQKETGEQLVNTFLIPRDKADEVLNENNETIKELREGALIAAGAELDSEEEQILKEAGDNTVFSAIGKQLADWSDEMSDVYLPIIKQNLGMFSDDVVRAIQAMINRINERRFYINPRVVYNEQPGWVSPEGYHANGGWIPKGTDTIPAMLTPGEYVQRRAAVQYFGKSFMDRINALDLRGALRSVYTSFATPYATGGFVRSDNRSYRDNHATVNQVFNSSNASTGLRRVSRFVRALN